ncbi:MAG: mannose-1-phosphate guanylyltransferase [Chloroflexi bacterium]|nr:mannose-1-phosphate guanylyltransferase [Chloroflexota bacterium]
MERYALIMAGGGGTRLWPLSRRNRPKQSLPLVTDKSMFRISVERLLPVFSPDHIIVVTGGAMVDDLREDCSEIPAENFVVEPSARDNGPAAGLGIMHIARRDPNAIIAYLPSDHHISDEAGFRNALDAACQIAEDDYIVTLGISPSFPSTAFGYIKRGDEIATINGLKICESQGFREKPDAETAMHFLTSGKYSWNAGMFIWKASQAVKEFQEQQPDMYRHLSAIHDVIGTNDYQAVLEREWDGIEKIALDYAIMENAKRMAVIPVDIGWSDIGNWSALYDVLSGTHEGTEAAVNIPRGNGELLTLNSEGTLVFSEKMVVTIGVKDVVIVDTDDVLLVCHRDYAQDVREAVNTLKAEGREQVL